MEDKIRLIGNLNNITEELNSYGLRLTREETSEFVNVLLSNKSYLQDGEMAVERMGFPGTGFSDPEVHYFLTPQYNYHISIGKTTLLILSWVLGKFTNDISNKILDFCGVSFRAITPIDEGNGEKCIVKETALYNKGVGDENILDKFNGDCCNMDLKCRLREEDKCRCTKQDIKNIYDGFVAKGVFRKTPNGYKLTF